MARYHINKRGEALPCSAKIKCRFGDIESQHYDTADEARDAYEASRKDAVPSAFSASDVNFTLKRESSLLSEALSSTSIKELSQGKSIDGFTFLGHGGEANVFLNVSKSMVYKIPRMDEEEEYDSATELRRHRIKQMRYAALDRIALSAEGVEYAPTYFLEIQTSTGDRVPVQAQPYLDDDTYVELSREDNPLETLAYEDTPRGDRIRELGLQDFATSNFRQRRSDGVLIMFDCLDFDDEDYWPYEEAYDI